MIDLGLSKLAIIGVVALVVIGPEKLPKVARMAGTLYGRAQRYLSEVKSEVSREIELEELRNLRKEVQEAADSVKQGVHGMESSLQQNMQEVENAWHADDGAPHDSYSTYNQAQASAEQQARKAKEFRRKRVVRTSNMPSWYKHQNGVKAHVTSGAARVARHRPRSKPPASFF
ncbi:MAG: Sec-independent protein translocase protein TatB [Burkholderiaceae bacterium]|nr:Sec-independent protein translocase protein TatB [Burkholderiaceae bacterium]